MESQELRRAFLAYFEARNHRIVPSASLIPHDDPTLLFQNAGMNQFKDLFLGKGKQDYTRATSCQKCIRVGGKHNDLEEVGHTSRHLTFFEMLGNFSFGDYFKEEAIAYAWEAVEKVFQLDLEKIWVSVFREDDEAAKIWENYLPARRIVRLDEKDNFWVMGETGPCGPCSELLYDRGEAYGAAKDPYGDPDGERYIEFWNLVFMQYHRRADGEMETLPKVAIDTGAGLERIVALKRGVNTLFETDVLFALIEKLGTLTDLPYEPDDLKKGAPFRVIADHLRSLSFAIADGAQPSNVERGYVLRKILRRAVRYGRQLGLTRPFLAELLPTLCETMGGDYPELLAAKGRIQEIFEQEEAAFLHTLRRGGNLLSQICEEAQRRGGMITGEEAFTLKDTYGLPLDEILLLARDSGLRVDLERYQELELHARERSRAGREKVTQEVATDLYQQLIHRHGPTDFIGYSQDEGEAVVTDLFFDGQLVERLPEGAEGQILLDRTPFYPEKGGQVGDRGELSWEGGRFQVEDTQAPFPGVILHWGKVVEGEMQRELGLRARIDWKRRRAIRASHTATHLLHWALCEVLGPHIRQAGSLVEADRLRFDFNHHKPLSPEELLRVEELVNEEVLANRQVNSYELSYEEAQNRREIKQFFGEKYGEKVRVVEAGAARELCGGTHAQSTGEIGSLVLLEERSVAAGMRRLVALTGKAAFAHWKGEQQLLNELAQLLQVAPGRLLARVSQLVEENTHYAREAKAARHTHLSQKAAKLAEGATRIRDLSVVIEEVEEELDLRELSEEILKQGERLICFLVQKKGGKALLLIRVASSLLGEGHDARKLLKELAPLIDGKGGGKAELAQAGGKNPAGIPELVQAAQSLLT